MALLGLGILLLLSLIALSNVLDIGERLSRLHWSLEYSFYALVLCAILWSAYQTRAVRHRNALPPASARAGVRCQRDPEGIQSGAEAFDRRRERQSANRHAAKDLLGVVLATTAQLPASIRTFLKAANFFCEPAHQA